MKAFLLLALLVSSAAFATEQNCEQRVEKVSCLITYKETPEDLQNREVVFSVHSPTFFCDGASNRFYHEEFPMGDQFVAWIYADWRSLDLAIYGKNDTGRMNEYAMARAPRIRDAEMHPYQSVSAYLPDGRYAQIMCNPVE